ncbi:hypothetical protein A8C32_03095 [Flavivirga aquatica]|uniref:Uncharacterized protein n=1 Tax=Flavivirga aquatica TaxID=1849968 RepID=A0A1E5TAN3_9FLAO|nr:hypothetical protein [Flavivirga aquatica]OEK08450.1 hypothetical protein A8C32_03095 [Flavivirga aquatica]
MQNNIKEKKTLRVTITDLYNDVFDLFFTKHQYSNLRFLIANNYPEELEHAKVVVYAVHAM